MTQTFARKVRVWPPEGYVAPTDGEFDGLLRAARRYGYGAMRYQWERLSDETVLRHHQLVPLAPRDRSRRDEKSLLDYVHQLNRVIGERKLTRLPSLALLRCQQCSHATERLFEATQDTHPGLRGGRTEKLIQSAWYCVRCWSYFGTDDEDEAEDER